MLLLTVGLALFLGIHLVPVLPGAKTALTRRYGALGYKAAFSIIAAAGLALTIIGFGQARAASALVWTPPDALRPVAMLLLLPVFPLLAAAYLPTGRLKAWTRHPMITAVILWAAAHILANGLAHELLLFGSFLAWALIDRAAHARRDTDAPRPALAANPWRYDLIAVVAGLALYAYFVIWAHQWVTGVPVL